ncbi:MAG: hypothetical protein DRJ64_03905 [Thermoprotei archaeon]|nr:MAG: hypothetical protein DRJ64_03905 [Thermoprotei archaeon]
MIDKLMRFLNKDILCLTGDIIPLTPFAILSPSTGKKGIKIGKDEFNRDVYLDIDSLPNPHGIITGTTGSGKSTLARSLAYRINKRQGTKTIFIDPHGEHAFFVKNVLKGEVIDAKNVPDILEPYCYDSMDWASELVSIFRDVYTLTDFQMYFLRQAFVKAIEERSIENAISYLKDSYDVSPLIKELFFKVFPVLKFFKSPSTNISVLLEKHAVDVSLFSIQNRELSIFTTLVLLSQIDSFMKSRGVQNKTETIVIVDEAHRIFTLSSRNILVRAYQETRKFGYGFWSINQLPGQIPYELYQLAGFLFFLPGPIEYVKELESIALLTEDDRDFLLYSIKGTAVFLRQGDPRPIRVILENIKEAF